MPHLFKDAIVQRRYESESLKDKPLFILNNVDVSKDIKKLWEEKNVLSLIPNIIDLQGDATESNEALNALLDKSFLEALPQNKSTSNLFAGIVTNSLLNDNISSLRSAPSLTNSNAYNGSSFKVKSIIFLYGEKAKRYMEKPENAIEEILKEIDDKEIERVLLKHNTKNPKNRKETSGNKKFSSKNDGKIGLNIIKSQYNVGEQDNLTDSQIINYIADSIANVAELNEVQELYKKAIPSLLPKFKKILNRKYSSSDALGVALTELITSVLGNLK